MITCDSCGCSGKDVVLREYRGSDRKKGYRELHVCDVCDEEIYRQQYDVLTNRLYATPQNRVTATERMAYSLPPQKSAWSTLIATVVGNLIGLTLFCIFLYLKHKWSTL